MVATTAPVQIKEFWGLKRTQGFTLGSEKHIKVLKPDLVFNSRSIAHYLKDLENSKLGFHSQ